MGSQTKRRHGSPFNTKARGHLLESELQRAKGFAV